MRAIPTYTQKSSLLAQIWVGCFIVLLLIGGLPKQLQAHAFTPAYAFSSSRVTGPITPTTTTTTVTTGTRSRQQKSNSLVLLYQAAHQQQLKEEESEKNKKKTSKTQIATTTATTRRKTIAATRAATSAKTTPTSRQSKTTTTNNNNNVSNKRSLYNNGIHNNSKSNYLNKNSADSKKYLQINKQLVQCENAKDLLLFLASQKGALTSPAGGGSLNSVNFSTAIHRLARHLNMHNQKDSKYNRAVILSDPRFALFMCSLAEALGGVNYNINKKGTLSSTSTSAHPMVIQFGSRELSNISWALAKMKIVPPLTASPHLTKNNYKTMLLDTAQHLRDTVVQVAKEKQQGLQSDSQAWIPTLSLLSGHIMDTMTLLDSAFVASDQERSNFIWALATAQRGSEQVFDILINKMIDSALEQQQQQQPQKQQEMRPQEWSIPLWAFATSQVYGTRGQERLISFMADALEAQASFREQFKPQEWSNTAWGVATILSNKNTEQVTKEEQDAAVKILRHVAVAVFERADEFKTQELANTLWAFATLGFGIASTTVAEKLTKGPGALNDYVVLESDDPEGDEKLLIRATDSVLKSALPRIQRFKSQELNNLAWALARMDRRDATVYLEAIGTQIADQRRKVSSQDIGTTMWSLATLEYPDHEIYRALASRVTVDGARFFKPQELSNTVWALATAELAPKYPDIYDNVLVQPKHQFLGALQAIDDPVTLTFGLAAQELMRRPLEFKPQEIKDVLWSFSKIGIRYPDLFKATAEHLVGSDNDINKNGGKGMRVRGVDGFSPQGLGNMAWAFARQAQLVGDVNERTGVAAKVATTVGRMAVYSTSFFDVGEILIQRLFNAIAEADLRLYDNLSKLKPQDLSNRAWAFAVLGMRHGPFLEAAERQLVARTTQYCKGGRNPMTFFKGQEMANLLWAFAVLNFPLRNVGSSITPYMLKCTMGSAKRLNAATIASVYKRQELANIAWSCAVFDDYPQNLMQFLYCGLVGNEKERDITYLNECFRDGGLQKENINSLLYLQLALEQMEQADGLSLPEGFPDGWGRQSLSRSNSNPMELEFEISLSTSKIQRDVGAAFHRIGFDHVEEYVLTADDVLDNRGIALSPSRFELLSIDIANPHSDIGIEVDGPAHFIANIETVPSEGGQSREVNGRLEYQFKMNGGRHQVNGPTALKKRLLERLGWKIINIPFWEWYDLNGDEAAEEAYCRAVLANIK